MGISVGITTFADILQYATEIWLAIRKCVDGPQLHLEACGSGRKAYKENRLEMSPENAFPTCLIMKDKILADKVKEHCRRTTGALVVTLIQCQQFSMTKSQQQCKIMNAYLHHEINKCPLPIRNSDTMEYATATSVYMDDLVNNLRFKTTFNKPKPYSNTQIHTYTHTHTHTSLNNSPP